jgi:hypothetical protein
MTRKAVMLALALAAAACASDPGTGPLGSGGNGGQQCIPAPLRVPRAMGDFTLHNTGTAPVTVNSVTLAGAHGLAQGKPWLLPIIGDQPLVGAALWPPRGRAWARRIPADGAVLRHGQNLNLVLEVWRTRSPWGIAQVTISYTASGTTYSLTEGWSVQVAGNCGD